jgi:hypothetical protein
MTDGRWAVFVSLALAPACSSSVVGGSAGSTGATGGQGGDGGATTVTSTYSGEAGGSSSCWPSCSGQELVCVDRAELWAQVQGEGAGGADTSGTTGGGGSGGAQGLGGAEGVGGAGAIPRGCPSAEQAAPFVGPTVQFWTDVGEPSLDGERCCYTVQWTSVGTGRPLLIEGRPATARVIGGRGWGTESIAIQTADVAEADRRLLATFWTEVAQLEHASVASFARLTLELLLVGAPADLVRDAQQAGLDEVRHAAQAFAIAGELAGERIGPGALPEIADLRPAVDVASMALAAVTEGCVAETLGAFEAAEQARGACAPLAERLRAIADDEMRHAALAWRVVRWAIDERGLERDRVRHAFAHAVAGARASLDHAPEPRAVDLSRFGLLDSPARRALHLDVLRRIEDLAATLVA